MTLVEKLRNRLRQPETFWLRISIDPPRKKWGNYTLHEVGDDFIVVAREKRDGTYAEPFHQPIWNITGLRICE